MFFISSLNAVTYNQVKGIWILIGFLDHTWVTDHLITNLDDLLIVLKHFNDSQRTLSQFLAVRFDGTIAAPHRNLVGGS